MEMATNAYQYMARAILEADYHVYFPYQDMSDFNLYRGLRNVLDAKKMTTYEYRKVKRVVRTAYPSYNSFLHIPETEGNIDVCRKTVLAMYTKMSVKAAKADLKEAERHHKEAMKALKGRDYFL